MRQGGGGGAEGHGRAAALSGAARPRIVVVLPPREAFSPHASGAIGLLVHRLAAAASPFDVEVLGPTTSAPFADVAFQPVRPALLPARHARRYAAGVARHLARPPALIEVHNRPDVALWLAPLQAPVTLVLHNDPRGMRHARTPAERGMLCRGVTVVTVSDWLRARLLDGVEHASVTVLPNCIDLREIPPPSARSDTILFAGRVVADKGADAFVHACAAALPRLPGWTAAMIGADRFGADSPDTPFLRTLRPQAARAGIAMPGWQPHAKVLQAMSRAAMVVVPSRWPEPFGMAALEAMACGAPVLCAPRGGLPEVVGDAGVMIDPDDPCALAEAIVALAQDPARRAALSQAGRTRAEKFDVTLAAAELTALRRRMLAAWPRGPRRPI